MADEEPPRKRARVAGPALPPGFARPDSSDSDDDADAATGPAPPPAAAAAAASDSFGPALPPHLQAARRAHIGPAPPPAAAGPSIGPPQPRASGDDAASIGPALPPHLQRGGGNIGPALPPGMAPANDDDDDDDDDAFGPMPVSAEVADALERESRIRDFEERTRRAEDSLKPVQPSTSRLPRPFTFFFFFFFFFF